MENRNNSGDKEDITTQTTEGNLLKILSEVDDNISKRRTCLSDKQFKKMFEPIRVDKFYTSGTISPNTSRYYTEEFENKMFEDYSYTFNGRPPIICTDRALCQDLHDFITIPADSILGTIVECKPDHFMVEAKGIRSRKILDKLVELGCKAHYEFLCHTRSATVYDKDTDEYKDVTEIYGDKSRIVCVNIIV